LEIEEGKLKRNALEHVDGKLTEVELKDWLEILHKKLSFSPLDYEKPMIQEMINTLSTVQSDKYIHVDEAEFNLNVRIIEIYMYFIRFLLVADKDSHILLNTSKERFSRAINYFYTRLPPETKRNFNG